MGEFDHSHEWLDESPASALLREAERTHTRYPNDFSDAEEAFADALRGSFSFEYDDAPPDYVQTLLEDELRAPTPEGYEQKITYQVLRRLDLPRRPLFERPPHRFLGMARSAWPDLAELRDGEAVRRAARYARRPLAGMLGLLAAVMISVLVLASPAFASGVQVLIAGHTGVQETQGYPTTTRLAAYNADADLHFASLLDVKTPISWLGSSVKGYVYQGIQLDQPSHPDWSDGPVVDMQYGRPDKHGGMSVLDIREFQIAPQYAAVQQAVQDGSATPTSVNGAAAVYIDGGWTTHVMYQNGSMTEGATSAVETHSWVTGGRTELIFEQGGVIFWIVGSPTDGMTMQSLVQFASLLRPMSPHLFLQKGTSLSQLGFNLSVSIAQYSQASEVLYLVNKGDSVTSGLGAFVTTSQ